MYSHACFQSHHRRQKPQYCLTLWPDHQDQPSNPGPAFGHQLQTILLWFTPCHGRESHHTRENVQFTLDCSKSHSWNPQALVPNPYKVTLPVGKSSTPKLRYQALRTLSSKKKDSGHHHARKAVAHVTLGLTLWVWSHTLIKIANAIAPCKKSRLALGFDLTTSTLTSFPPR